MATIAELVEDRTVDGVFAVARKRRLTTSRGKPYLALELVDPSGRIEGRVWDDVELLDRRFAEGDAVRVLGRVERFDGRLQLAVRTVEAADADPATLAPALRRDADELEGFLEFLAAEVAHPGLAGIVSGILAEPEVRDGMRLLPAAGADGHHGYAGRPARAHRRGRHALPRDCAAPSSAACRPPARCRAAPRRRPRARARPGPAFRPTPEGALLGHVQLGVRLVDERANALDSAARAELLHAIAAHHDRSAARTAEAAVLYHANQLDAQAATRSVGAD